MDNPGQADSVQQLRLALYYLNELTINVQDGIDEGRLSEQPWGTFLEEIQPILVTAQRASSQAVLEAQVKRLLELIKRNELIPFFILAMQRNPQLAPLFASLLTLSREAMTDEFGDIADLSRLESIPLPDISPLPDERTETTEAAEEPAPDRKQRYLNAYFTESQASATPYDLNAPLYTDRDYYLRVQISSKLIGSGSPEARALNETPLHEAFAKQGYADLTVVLHSQTLHFEQPGQPIYKGALRLFKDKDSTPVVCQVLLPDVGTHAIDIDLYYKGHILKDLEYTIRVVDHAEAGAATDPPQRVGVRASIGELTQLLQTDTLENLQARTFAFTFSKSPVNDCFNAVVFTRHDGEEAVYPTSITTHRLVSLCGRAATVLEDMCKKFEGHPADCAILAPHDLWDRHRANLASYLGQLAGIGRHLYYKLFLDRGDHIPEPALVPGSVIQITPIHDSATAPWSLMYTHKIKTDPPWKLCDAFPHYDQPCPHAEDSSVVCPHGFWGIEHIIEQLPIRYGEPVDPDEDTATLGYVIENHDRLYIEAIMHHDFARCRQHLVDLANVVKPVSPQSLSIRPVFSKQELREGLTVQTDTWAAPQVLYFFSHGERLGQQTLVIGANNNADETITELEIAEHWPPVHAPLVVMNGCSTGAYGPWDYGSLIRAFQKRGAAGVVGTQSTVIDLLAQDYGFRFFKKLFAQEPVGRAMQQTNRELMELCNPYGLVYSLFASANLVLARPILHVTA